jgi:O-antigen/teichoic acid export membrane protein
MTYNSEIAQASDRRRQKSVSPTKVALDVPPPAVDAPARVDETGVELKRGAFVNTLAMLASNLRGIFTFLIARLLGPAALGTFSVAWATTDLLSKLGVFGLDNTITTFVARAEAKGEHRRSRALFRIAAAVGVIQSAIIAVSAVFVVQIFGDRLGLNREVVAALAVTVCALPGVALYRISTSTSRGMKVMRHDLFSRGMTEPIATTGGFVLLVLLGLKRFAPELAAIVGTAASGIVAANLAARLFRGTAESTHQPRLHPDLKSLLGYATPITAYQFLNAIIFRLDVVMLGWFVGRAPGVTLVTVGVYGAVVDVANGLRKVNQVFNPIFAPVVAGMTATGNQIRAAATYARLAQWMLWILLPLVAVMVLAGSTILLIFGPAFRQGSLWLGIVAVACATNAFVALGETVIMVQRPRLNLLNSSITCAVAVGANLWLIPRFGVTGAALGILLPYAVQGILRYAALRLVFHWPNPWSEVRPPIESAILGLLCALPARFLVHGIAGQVASALVFLALFGAGWLYHQRSNK